MQAGGNDDVYGIHATDQVLIIADVFSLILFRAETTTSLTDVDDADQFGLGELIVDAGVVDPHISSSDYANFDWFQNHASFDPLDPVSLNFCARREVFPTSGREQAL